jgi:hypothetical protein
MASFSPKNLPAVGTWVTFIQSGSRGNKARKANVQKTPALVSAVSAEGTVTVLYPNNFVLMHGFKGEPLKRVSDVAAAQLRPFTGSDVSLQILEKALLAAVKAGAQDRRSLPCQPATPQRSVMAEKTESVQANTPRRLATPQRAPLSPHCGGAPRKRPRSRSPSPLHEQVSCSTSNENMSEAGPPEVQTTPVRESTTPIRRRLSRKTSEEKAELAPSGDGDRVAIHGTSPTTLKGLARFGLIEASPRRRHTMTSLVGRMLRSSESGRLPRDELEAALSHGGFDAAEVAAGLQRLDDSNKILLMDGLVFLV